MASKSDDPNQQDVRFGFECLKSIDKDGKVDLGKVGSALGYTNIYSVGNRFRAMRTKYGFTSLESKTGTTPLKEKTTPKANANSNDGTPTKRARGRPALGGTPTKTTGVARKRAKVSTAEPIPATGPVFKEEPEYEEEEEELVVKKEPGDREGPEDDYSQGEDSEEEVKIKDEGETA
ncbi:hypothetical protein BJX70DRAFT_286290 [Aspergillus crustosus]